MSNNTTPSKKTQPSFSNVPKHHHPLQNNGLGMQTQTQLGAGNHHQNQNLIPFMPNMQQSMNTPPFMNAPNHMFPLQNNPMQYPHMGLAGPQQGQSFVGLGPQNSVGNASYNPVFPLQGQVMQNAPQMNLSQLQGLAQGILNMLQQPNNMNMNMNMNMPNGQFCAPYPVQNMNQHLPMQMSNPSQVVPYGMHHGSHPMFGFPNQVPQAMVPQNPIFSSNHQLGHVPGNQVRPLVNQNEKNPFLPQQLHPVPGNQVRPQVNQNEKNPFLPQQLHPVPGNQVRPQVNQSGKNPFSPQQLQGNNNSASLNPNSVHLHHTNNSQPSAFTKSQANPNSNINTNVPNSNWKGSPSQNFKNKPNREGFQGGFQKSKFHNINNGKRKLGSPEERKGKGPNNGMAGHFGSNFMEHKQEPKRSFSVTYTEQEIQQWREARRKNHPVNNNIQEQQSKHVKNSKVIDREVLQRELKEVLAKQAELGVEVAEIPSYYLKDSKNQGLQGEGKNTFTEKRKFKNKFNKRSDRKGRFAKKQKFANKDFSDGPSLNKREPTLLQKLLSADIKRDKSYLFQVFRFMVVNSFFKDCPDKPLIYPSVVVKEMGSEGDALEKHLHPRKVALEYGEEKTVQKIVSHDNDNGHDSEDEESGEDENDSIVHINPHKQPSPMVKRQCDDGETIESSDEEEDGQII